MWEGDMSEGLLYSLGLTINDAFHGNLSSTDPQRISRAKLALHDLILAMLSMLLGYLLLANTRKKKDERLDQYEKLALKIMMNSTGEFDPFSTVFGTVNATPAFISITGDA